MKLIKSIIVPIGVVLGLSLFLLMTACNGDKGSNVVPSSNTNNTPDTSRIDTDRNECSAGGGACADSQECMDKCDKSKDDIGGLFSGNEKKDCQKLTVNEVEQMHKAFSEQDGILEEPEVDKLASICPSAIKNLIKIDNRMKIWDAFLKEYNPDEAIRVVSWIAQDAAVFASIDPEDEKHLDDFLKALFKGIDDDFIEALTDNLVEQEDFVFNIAGESENKGFIEKVYSLFDGTASYCSTAIAGITTSKHKTPHCFVKEVLCHESSDGYIFEDSFSEVVKIRALSSYIKDTKNVSTDSDPNTSSGGLGVEQDNFDQADTVCEAIDGLLT